MAANHGVRDGAFVSFRGWDVPGYDQAYDPKLRGKTDALKKIVLEKKAEAFYVFSTDGWIKAWDFLDYSVFEPNNSGLTLFVRVEYL